MDYMFEAGFLGTKAPLFMDMVTLIVALLPLLVYGAILLARKKMYLLHTIVQNFIFVFSVIVVAYFELGVRVGGGFDAFMSESGVEYTYALIVLIVHIFIAVTTLFYWSRTMITGNVAFKQGALPGRASYSHKVLAFKTVLGITLTSFTGIWVYLLLFVF
ncbi:MAG: DUF420 domain-containing protein [Campylobacterota bacterium]|nr:DUF420 domain-containing protein [Campylobacterota bacterium]